MNESIIDLIKLKQEVKKYIENSIYDKDSIKNLQLLDHSSNWWIFDFKGAFFDSIIAEKISKLFWNEIETMVAKGETVAIGGMESGAIPIVSALTLFPSKNFKVSGFFIRKAKKKSDLAKDIEGYIPEGAKIVIVDDILNSGKSIEKAKKILEANNKTISFNFSIVRYRDKVFYDKKNLFNDVYNLSLFELNDFRVSLGLENISEKIKLVTTRTYSHIWNVQLCKPNPYHVIPKSAPLLYNGFLYFGTDDGTFYALGSTNGSVKWSYKILFGASGKRIYSSPAAYQNTIFFGAYDGNLYALDAITGKKKWVFFDADWVGSSPCVAEDLGLIFIGLEFGLLKKKGGIAAVSVLTGKLIWNFYEMDGLTHASPAYSKKFNVVVCGCNNKKIYCFDAKKGDLKWVFETKGEVKYGAMFDEKKGVVYVGSMDGCVYKIDIKSGELLMTFKTEAGIYSTPVFTEQLLVVGSLDKKIYCWNNETGQIVWSFQTSGRIFASPIIKKNLVYIGSNDGRLRVININNGTLEGEILFAERVVNKICLENNTIYVPTQACEIYAYQEVLKTMN